MEFKKVPLFFLFLSLGCVVLAEEATETQTPAEASVSAESEVQQEATLKTGDPEITGTEPEVSSEGASEETDPSAGYELVPVPVCHDYWYYCPYLGECIQKISLCDGVNDCGDLLDESRCNETACFEGETLCPSGKCILDSWKCDGQADCEDGSDEVNCEPRQCPPARFQCNDHRCIPVGWLCDGADDCGDNLDEEDCEFPECTASQFKCENRRCVPSEYRCDREDDCGDGSDEVACPAPVQAEEQPTEAAVEETVEVPAAPTEEEKATSE